MEPAVVSRLAAAVEKVLAAPALQARLAELGSMPGSLGPVEYTRFVAEEAERWAPVVRASGAQAG